MQGFVLLFSCTQGPLTNILTTRVNSIVLPRSGTKPTLLSATIGEGQISLLLS